MTDTHDDNEPFWKWVGRWMRFGKYPGDEPGDAAKSIAGLIEMWRGPIPGDWQRRGVSKRRLDPKRYIRGDERAPRKGEHELESQLLGRGPEPFGLTWLGRPVRDGVNAVPLARDSAGGERKGNVEADVLLLVEAEAGYEQWLVEVKTGSNDAWYATVENLLQLKLMLASPVARRIFHERRVVRHLPEEVAVRGAVLAPRTYYTSPGRRGKSVGPASRLVRAINADVGADLISLLVWAPEIERLAPPKPQ